MRYKRRVMNRRFAFTSGPRARALLLLAGAVVTGCGDEKPSSSTPGPPGAVLARAEELSARHRVVEALEAIEAYVSSRPSSASVISQEAPLWEKWAALLLNASRPREAEEVLLELQQVGPFGPHRHRLLAESYLKQGAYRKAVRAYQELPAAKRLDELLDYAKAALRSGHREEGAAIAAAALVRDPWLDEAYLSFGRAQMRLGRESLAETFLARYHGGEAYRQAMLQVVEFEFGGLRSRALLEQARAERERGRLWEAMQMANQALKEDPKLGSAYLELARISLFLERPWDAIPQLEKLPHRADVLGLLAEAYQQAGETERARRTYGAALGKEPGRADLQERLAGLESGAPRDPLEVFRRDVRLRIRKKPLSRCVPDLLELSESSARHGKQADARALGLFLVRLDPRDSEARMRVTRLFQRPEDAFVRLWLLAPVAGARKELDREFGELGLRRDLVRRALEGEAIVELR